MHAALLCMRHRNLTHPVCFVRPAQGKDHTLFALIDGNIKFTKDRRLKRRSVHVHPPLQAAATEHAAL